MNDIQQCVVYNFKEISDERGQMVAIEGGGGIPFEIKRLFYIYGTQSGIIRGQHANRDSEFVLINVCGSSKVKVFDGTDEMIINLDKPRKGVYIPKMIWKDMYDFSADSVLLVLASTHYDSSEYIRNLDEYVDIVKENRLVNGNGGSISQ